MPIDPATLSDKRLWVRAKDQTGSNGSTVTSLLDASGTGADALYFTNTTVKTGATPSGGKSLNLSGASIPLPDVINKLRVDGSGTLANGYEPWRAVDGNSGGSAWLSANNAGPHWLRLRNILHATSPITATSYTIYGDQSVTSHSPQDFKFQGSSNGSSWTDLDTRTGISWTTAPQTFNFSNSTAYEYYRLYVTATASGSYVTIYDITLNGTAWPQYTGPGELWLVVKSLTTSGSAWQFGTSGSANHYTFSGDVYTDFGNGSRRNYTPSPSLASTWRLIRMSIDGSGSLKELVDETSNLTASSVTSAFNRNPTLSASWTGEIAEVFLRASVSSTGEVADLITYFNTEHGLTVPGGSSDARTGEVAATIGAVGASITGTVPVTGQVAATIGALTGTATGTSTVTGQVAGTVDVTAAVDGVSINVGVVAATIALQAAVVGDVPQDLTPSKNDPVGITDAVSRTLVDGGAAVVTINDPVGITDTVTTAHRMPGSVWLPYPVSDSGSQVLDFSIVPTSPEEPWPFAWEGDGYSNSLWLDFTATGSDTLTVSLDTTFPAGIEVWSGDVVDDPEADLSPEGYGQGSIEVAIAPGQHIYLRAHPLSDTETGSGTLTWSVAARPATGVLGFVCAPTILETPGWLGVSMLSTPPESAVTFALDGGSTFFTVTTEDDGTFMGAVELPALAAGGHTITATDVNGQSDTQPFVVLIDVFPDETIPGSSGPATPPSPDPVIKWVLEDPMPGGLGTYAFPINPSEMSSPWSGRQLRPERTIHGSGNDIVWEGRSDPVEWTVKGITLTEAFYDALTAFQALQRRLYVVDHHQRAWIVAFDGLSFIKRGRPDGWEHSYEAKFLILSGPVTL